MNLLNKGQMSKKINIGISIGDINGIGPEVILKTFKDNRMLDFCVPIIFGSSKVISFYKRHFKFKQPNLNVIKNLENINDKQVNVFEIDIDNAKINFGKEEQVSGKHSMKSIEMACNVLKKNKIDALVTAPINKKSIQKNVKEFVGHTEYLENNFKGNSLMLMVSDVMKIAFVSGHIPLSSVKEKITKDIILSKFNILHDSLIKDFNITNPKIAILGLNPHAGEEGMLGTEELNVIIPAIDELKKMNKLAFGPYPADSFFNNRNLNAFDGILSMYHDQGLTPFKTISFYDGVNYTCGLDIIRTSPVHGTAYSISGKDMANERSFRNAIFLACEIHKNRKILNTAN